VNKNRTSRLMYKVILCTLAVTGTTWLLFGGMAMAQAGAPKRLANVQPGDCAACHAGGKQVLPGTHPNTKAMTLQQCLMCHKNDKTPLKDKMPSSHAHMLSGISCQKCHGAGGAVSKVGMKTCTACHGIEGLAKAPAKGTDRPNPHNSHYGTDVDCNTCHHQHAKSEFFCAQCHKFSNVTPSPMLPLSFSEKETEAKAPAAAPAVSGEAAPATAPGGAPGPALSCTTCHSGAQYQKYFAQTRHGKLGCAICHKGIKDFNKHMKGQQKPEAVSCLTCHQDIQKQGFHATVKKISCLQCHTDIHPKEAAGAKKVMAAPAAAAGAAMDCSTCHSGPKFKQHFSQTPHGALSCTVCHQGITDFTRHMQKKEKPQLVSCAVCHKDIERQYAGSFHAKVANISCLQCHTDIHPESAVSGKKGKVAGVQTCLRCHSDQDKYLKKGHTAKVLAGNEDAPSCADCHGVHNTRVFAATAQGVAEKRAYYTGLCVSCHREGGVAGRYGIFPMAVTSYGETYHGKVMKLGYPDRVAGCADCHTGHNILPAGDPASVLNPDQLVKTCGKCHQGFHKRFVSYVPHPVPDDPKRFFSLYLTKIFMIALLVGVFGFFWLHSLLWWRKVYAEKSCLRRQGLQVKAELPEDAGRQYVRRFGVKERIMHVLLILSFFGVIVSGFPLKYPEAWWSKVFITLFGSVSAAGDLHRISAALMGILFLYTCWLSLKFLFPGFRFKGWVGRLFGPDSLFPRIKDFQDMWGMFKWFFNRGEKPEFDRWTYWEKFDFMAVFWGMFVIGLSGLVMWIPEWSSYIMPGWMINIVHLAHSEEAFLAAVFIFTVHFFNNHLVPDKFPLEANVFTGSYTLEALKRERPLEYERILEENRLEEIKCKGPGTAIQLFAGVFGIASVLVGLGLTVLIFWAVFVGL